MLLTKNSEMRLGQRTIKRRAWVLLGERGNLLRLSCAFLCSLAIVGTAMHLFESVCYFIFSEMIPIYMMAAEMIMIFALALPLWMGLSRMAYRMCTLDRTQISNLLYYFEKKRIADAYRVSLSVTGAVVVELALSFALGWLIAYAASGFGNKIFPDETYILAFIFFLPISGMLSWVYILPNEFFKSEDFRVAVSCCKNSSPLSAKEIIVLNFSFVPLIILSVLSLGILFVVYTIPLYLVSVQLFILEKAGKKENL